MKERADIVTKRMQLNRYTGLPSTNTNHCSHSFLRCDRNYSRLSWSAFPASPVSPALREFSVPIEPTLSKILHPRAAPAGLHKASYVTSSVRRGASYFTYTP